MSVASGISVLSIAIANAGVKESCVSQRSNSSKLSLSVGTGAISLRGRVEPLQSMGPSTPERYHVCHCVM